MRIWSLAYCIIIIYSYICITDGVYDGAKSPPRLFGGGIFRFNMLTISELRGLINALDKI